MNNPFEKYVPEKIKSRYNKFKKYQPAVFFIFGAVWDTITLQRIDNPFDLTILGAFLVCAGVVIILIGKQVTFKFSEYLPSALQFFYGSLFSAFRVYYFKSAASWPSLLFMLFLIVLLVGNEFFEKRFHSVTLPFTLWGISCVMYLTYALPVITSHMNFLVFLLGVAMSFFACWGIQTLFLPGINLKPVMVFYPALILLYLTNVIPPVPLSVKNIGIYRSILKVNNSYLCTMSRPDWYHAFSKSEDRFCYNYGDTVFCFSSIFAPTDLTTKIAHHWFYKAPRSREFVEMSEFGFSMIGGRAEGYRGFSYKCNIQPGDWKVMIKTKEGKTIGIKTFTVIQCQRRTAYLKQLRF